ncbi:MAG: hypothetical protein Q9201_004857 [Fulgogasparrea decipioides]
MLEESCLSIPQLLGRDVIQVSTRGIQRYKMSPFAKPILSKSQCWCVDGESKFVLPVGPHTYYRIELPNATAEDRTKVEEFKATLEKILQYETTPCPFKRGFTVDLPEKPNTPVRKKPWRPRERVQPASTAEQANRRPRELRAWERSRDPAEQLPETDQRSEAEEEMLGEPTSPTQDEREGSSDSGHKRETTDDRDLTPRDHTMHDHQHFDPYKTPTRPRPLKAGRATTAPPQLSLCTTPPSDTADVRDETASLSSSLNSFHSFHSPISPLPPSPRLPLLSPSLDPEDDRGIIIPKARIHTRDSSEITVTAAPGDFWQTSEPKILDRTANPATPEPPQTPPLVSDTTSQSEEPSPGPITPLLTQIKEIHSAMSISTSLTREYLLTNFTALRASPDNCDPAKDLLNGRRSSGLTGCFDAQHRFQNLGWYLQWISFWLRRAK